jgi:hypothetical protein
MVFNNNNKGKKMDFFKKHKLPLIVGVSCFGVGYVTGGIMEARSMQQELAQNIFNQVVGQQNRMRESREADEKRFKSIPPLSGFSKKKHFLPDVGVEEVDLPGKYYVEMKVKAIGNPTPENIELVKGMNARLIEGNTPYEEWVSAQKGTQPPAIKDGS